MLSLDLLDELIGFVAAEANHTADKKLEKALDRVFDKVDKLLARYTEIEDEPPGSLVRPKSRMNHVIAMAWRIRRG
jgi:benzoyl-CoA reductase/2-hydroxyglutaryl-CoA dehydratase subunit BcrC/BadD/HgdB